jgi:hypothetical protein
MYLFKDGIISLFSDAQATNNKNFHHETGRISCFSIFNHGDAQSLSSSVVGASGDRQLANEGRQGSGGGHGRGELWVEVARGQTVMRIGGR